MYTTNVISTTKNLNLTSRQLNTLRTILMKNNLRDIHRTLSSLEREKKTSMQKSSNILNQQQVEQLKSLVKEETTRTTTTTKQYYKEKYKWFLQKRNNSTEEIIIPNEENLSFTYDIPESFESEPRIYGGISINDNERATLTLPPKYAVFKKIEPIKIKAEIEKALTKYRWKKEIDLPFNKTVCMPPYADNEIETNINSAKLQLYKVIVIV